MGTGSCTKSPAWKHTEVTDPGVGPTTATPTIISCCPDPAGAVQGPVHSLTKGPSIHSPHHGSDLPEMPVRAGQPYTKPSSGLAPIPPRARPSWLLPQHPLLPRLPASSPANSCPRMSLLHDDPCRAWPPTPCIPSPKGPSPEPSLWWALRGGRDRAAAGRHSADIHV